MLSALVAATLAVVAYSLWVRRHTWRSRWEAAASLAIAADGCALTLMSPWTSNGLGPVFHDVVGRWNVQHLLGHICLIVSVAAIIYHCLLRLVDAGRVRMLFRKHVTAPLQVGLAVLLVVFAIADADHQPDLFSAHVDDIWLAAYWLVVGILLIYVSGYAGQVLLIMRRDPRARATANRYLVSAAFGVAAVVIQLGTAWAGLDVSLPVWLCACLAVATFAYGSARSWQAKAAWFTASARPPGSPERSKPPQPDAYDT